jgi:uncharacterized protein YyaL (SSP411 family)
MLPQFDPQYGGFANGQGGAKFPNPVRLALLLFDYQLNQTSAALSGVLNTLALDTAQYLGRDMMAPDGGFYTARDAQQHGIEGEGYLWARGEIVSLLGETEAVRFLGVYSLTRLPRSHVPDVVQPREVNREPPAVLRLQVPVKRTLKAAGFAEAVEMIAAFAGDREKLLAARQQHPQPRATKRL